MGALNWTRGSFNYDGFTGTPVTLPVIDLNIPAGAVLKKFVVCNANFQGFIQGNDYRAVTPVHVVQTVTFTTGHYAGRILYETFRCPTMAHGEFLSSLSGTQFYTTYFSGGDEVFGIDQKCSYGQLGFPAMNLRYSAVISAQGWGITPSQRFEMNTTFKALFYL